MAPEPAGLGFTVSVMVAPAGLTVSVEGAEVLPAKELPGAGLNVDVTVYVPGTPGAGNTPVKAPPLTGKGNWVLVPFVAVTCISIGG